MSSEMKVSNENGFNMQCVSCFRGVDPPQRKTKAVHRMMCWTRDVTSLMTYPANGQPHIQPVLTHWDLMTHIWSENCLACSCNVNHCWCINRTIGDICQWYLNQDMIIFLEEIEYEIVLCTAPICLSLDMLTEMTRAKKMLSTEAHCRYVACFTKYLLAVAENGWLIKLLLFIQGYSTPESKEPQIDVNLITRSICYQGADPGFEVRGDANGFENWKIWRAGAGWGWGCWVGGGLSLMMIISYVGVPISQGAYIKNTLYVTIF